MVLATGWGELKGFADAISSLVPPAVDIRVILYLSAIMTASFEAGRSLA